MTNDNHLLPGPLPKVFGIGLSKTATSSLSDALNLLGIRTIHYPFDAETLRQLKRGDLRLSILERFQGVADTPVVPYYAQLDKIYPGSRFILTVRDKQRWLKSIDAHWHFTQEWCRRNRHFARFHEFNAAAVYGTLEFNADRFSYVYDLHYRNVLEYFEGRPQDLLVIDICSGQGWDTLCPFLGVSTSDVNFPHANRKEDKDNGWQWMNRIDAASNELDECQDFDIKVALVDDSQLVGSSMDHQVAARFLEHDGVYGGPPSDDAQAIAETERLRANGIARLAIAWPAFSWLEHYPVWATYLYTRCPIVSESEQLRIFNINGFPTDSVESSQRSASLADHASE